MRKIFVAIFSIVIAVAISVSADSCGKNFSLSQSRGAAGPNGEETDTTDDYCDVWRDTIMFADGHAFSNVGDISSWDGWYFDTIRVGDDRMLEADSVGPSTLRLNIVTREITVDLRNPHAAEEIKKLLGPIDGFHRFRKGDEMCVDSFPYENYGMVRIMGQLSFSADFADSSVVNSALINQFVCDLTGISENKKISFPSAVALYIGHNRNIYPHKKPKMADVDMLAIYDFYKDCIVEEWKKSGSGDIMGGYGADLAIRAHIINSYFVTFGKYEYDREGLGHGMYTHTFHTFDFESGKELTNYDIFNPQALDKVRLLLFETIAADAKFQRWHPRLKSAKEVPILIDMWKDPGTIDEGENEVRAQEEFALPEGALTDKGVVFSFQPYEIDCWAAGSYHFIVPYKKLMPYLTPKAKSMIKDYAS